MQRPAIILLFLITCTELRAADPPEIDDRSSHDRYMFLKAARYLQQNGHKSLAEKYYYQALSAWQSEEQQEHLDLACRQYFKFKSNRKGKMPREESFNDCSEKFRDTYFGRVDRDYILVYRHPHKAPNAALRRAISGWVILSFDISESGKSENVTVVESTNPIFDKVAVKSQYKSWYLPKIVSGKVVATTNAHARLSFEIE